LFSNHVMSKIPTPEELLKRIKSLLTALPKEIETYCKLPKTSPGPVRLLLTEFTTNPRIKTLTEAPQSQKGTTSQSEHASELAHIKTSLQLLSKAVSGLQKANTTPSNKAKPSRGDALHANKTVHMHSAAAGTRPANASIILDLGQIQSAHAFRPRPVEISGLINEALLTSPHHQISISAVRWTAKGNLVVIGGYDVTLHQLQLAASTIAQTFANAYSVAVNPTPPPTRANVRWSKMLINGLPTGASDTRAAFTPEECHRSLAANNPSYSILPITQKPSWVHPPSSYKANSSSSLVVAFEDPDGERLKSMLAARFIYALGTRATVKKWKQKAPTRKQAPPNISDLCATEWDFETPSRAQTPSLPQALPATASPQSPRTQLCQLLNAANSSSDEEDAEIAGILARPQTPSPIQTTRASTHPRMLVSQLTQIPNNTQVQQPRAPPQRSQPSRQAKAKKTAQRE
jgi:hypothetical protein